MFRHKRYLSIMSPLMPRISSNKLIYQLSPGFDLHPPYLIRMVWNPFRKKEKDIDPEKKEVLKSTSVKDNDEYEEISDSDVSEYEEDSEEEVFWESRDDLIEDITGILNHFTKQVTLEPGFHGVSFENNCVKEITPDSPAEKLGIRVGWTVLNINGKTEFNDEVMINKEIEEMQKKGEPAIISFSESTSPHAFKDLNLKFKILDKCIETFGIDIPSIDLEKLTNGNSLVNYFWERQLQIDAELEEIEMDKSNPMPKNLKVFY